MEWRQKIPEIDETFGADRGIDGEGDADLAIVEALREIAEQLDYMNRLAEDKKRDELP